MSKSLERPRPLLFIRYILILLLLRTTYSVTTAATTQKTTTGTTQSTTYFTTKPTTTETTQSTTSGTTQTTTTRTTQSTTSFTTKPTTTGTTQSTTSFTTKPTTTGTTQSTTSFTTKPTTTGTTQSTTYFTTKPTTTGTTQSTTSGTTQTTTTRTTQSTTSLTTKPTTTGTTQSTTSFTTKPTTTGTTQSTTSFTTKPTTTGTTQSTTSFTTQPTTTGTTQSTTSFTTKPTTTGTTQSTTSFATQPTTTGTTQPTTSGTTQTTTTYTTQSTTSATTQPTSTTTTQTTTTYTTQTTTTGTTQSTTSLTTQITTTATTKPTTTATTKPTTTTTTKPTTDILDSLSPKRGPVAGGTKVIFRGQRLNETISNIYFGFAGNGTIISSTYDSLTVYSPAAQYNGSVTIGLTFNGIPTTTNLTFEYRPNPSIDRFLAAPVQLTSGGSLLTVVGTSLDSVVYPLVNVTVVYVQPVSCNPCRRAANLMQPYANSSYLGNCTYKSSEKMTCLLPDLQLPENFTSKLQEDRRNQRNFSTTEPGSVAILFGPDGSEAYVYLGFIFDGYGKYENVSDPKSGLQDQLHLNFIPPPVIKASTELIIFDPKKEDEIQIKGEFLLGGCNYGVECEILVGNAQCCITQVTDNVITCAPPKEKPLQSANDSFCRPNHPNSLNIEIHIGFRTYYYKCLDYYFLNVGLIVGLTVGLGIPALIAITVALFFGIRKFRSRKKPPPNRRQLPRFEDVNPAESSFKEPPSPSNLTTFSQNRKRNTIFQNLRMSILRNSNANDYSSEIPNDNYLQSQDDGEPQTDDVESQTDDVASCPRNYNRRTFYPPDYRPRTGNEYMSNINDDSAESAAYNNRSGPSGGAGRLQSPSKQSYIQPTFGNSWEDYDNKFSLNGDESEDKETYANFGELSFNR